MLPSPVGALAIGASVVMLDSAIKAYDKTSFVLTSPRLNGLWDKSKRAVKISGVVGPVALGGLWVATGFTLSPILATAAAAATLITAKAYVQTKNRLSVLTPQGKAITALAF